jgi:hypothetical protein
VGIVDGSFFSEHRCGYGPIRLDEPRISIVARGGRVAAQDPNCSGESVDARSHQFIGEGSVDSKYAVQMRGRIVGIGEVSCPEPAFCGAESPTHH